jgi:transposase InsO family protein
MDLWAYAHGVTLDFSRPGKLTDNVFIETLTTTPTGSWALKSKM